ncbi:hypothetical protein BCU17_04740 [Vibrio splendidus]|uniref:Uncharacterized protein n=1 Tax=Vibrio splendidus TaxID=29497 RepID=A0A2N7F7W1_VIBSP|nr:hypothetical protein [Vibrio splendidus]PMJ62249.1 hypothetical protein BCU17_04740 [Vibrio splendidus]
MDRAYNKTSDKIEYAYKLKEFSKAYIENSKYFCPNPLCRYVATPCSYKAHNIYQPYYKYIDGHSMGCCFSPEFGGREAIDAKGRKHWVLPKVVEITLPKDDSELKRNGGPGSGNTLANTRNDNSTGKKGNGKGQGKLSSSVAAATIFYMQDVEINALEPLTLPDVKGKYRSVFQQIFNWSNIESYKPGHIFYADLRYTSELFISKDVISITLNVKEPQSSKWFELKLCCNDWSNRERNAIVDELKRAKRFAAEVQNKNEVASVYFIGRQNEFEKHIFECDYAQFLYVFTGERVKLENNYFGFNRKAEVTVPPVENSSRVQPNIPFIEEIEENLTSRNEYLEGPLEIQQPKPDDNHEASTFDNSSNVQSYEVIDALNSQTSIAPQITVDVDKAKQKTVTVDVKSEPSDKLDKYPIKPVAEKHSIFKQVLNRVASFFVD